jgi:hypothetical protein
MTDLITSFGVAENKNQSAPDLFNRLNLPGQSAEMSGKLMPPGKLNELLKHKPDLQSGDFIPPLQVSDGHFNFFGLLKSKAEQAKEQAARQEKEQRDSVIKQVPADSLKQLDMLRLELSVTTGKQESEAKQKEVSSFLTGKLQDKLPEEGLKALLAPQPFNDLLNEVKAARPAEAGELVKQARANLVSNAEHAITNGAKLKDFNEKLAAFDTRAAARSLAESEVLSTYLQIGRVLNPGLTLEHGDKSLLARSMMANVADPTSIDQGSHNTCNVTTLECRLCTQEPGAASKVVADVACGGQFVTADGTRVHPLNLDPDSEGRFDPAPDGLRNYASQIFQLTAINAYWNRRDTMPGGKTVGKGNIQYAQGPDGEYLLDVSKNPPQKQHFDTVDSGHPWLDLYGVSEINQQLTGRPSKNFGIERWVYPSESEGVSKIVTLNGFKNRLVELKDEKAFPIIIEVDASKKPFGDGKGFGPHVVTITDYDPASGLVTVDNQWGKSDDQTGLPGQKAKPSAELLWESMSQLPSLDFYWSTFKDGLKGIKAKDAIPPTVSALSTKGLFWGMSAAAPLAVRGGLGYLSEWGVPGAESLLSASETRLGQATLRAGASLAALGAFAYINDLPGAFKQGNSHGVGKLTRITGDFASFEIGSKVADKALSAVGLWTPARLGLDVAAGVATSTVFDRLMGESSEIAGSMVYDRVHDYLRPSKHLSAPEKTIKSFSMPLGSAGNLHVESPAQKSMTSYFADQNKRFGEVFKP